MIIILLFSVQTPWRIRWRYPRCGWTDRPHLRNGTTRDYAERNRRPVRNGNRRKNGWIRQPFLRTPEHFACRHTGARGTRMRQNAGQTHAIVRRSPVICRAATDHRSPIASSSSPPTVGFCRMTCAPWRRRKAFAHWSPRLEGVRCKVHGLGVQTHQYKYNFRWFFLFFVISKWNFQCPLKVRFLCRDYGPWKPLK